MPRWPDVSSVQWTPGETDRLRYEGAVFNGRNLTVWKNTRSRWEAVVAGFPLSRSFPSADEAKAAAVRKAAS